MKIYCGICLLYYNGKLFKKIININIKIRDYFFVKLPDEPRSEDRKYFTKFLRVEKIILHYYTCYITKIN